MKSGSHLRLYVWAECPERRQQVKQRLTVEQWSVLPVFQEGAALAGSLAAGKADGIIFDAVEKVERVVKNLELLEEQFPACARFVIAAEKNQDIFRLWKGLAPTLLKEEASEASWISIITRAITLNRWFMKPEIRRMLPRIRAIPTLPATHRRVVEVLQDPQFRVDEVAGLIVHDVTLTAHLLKTVNSAMFAPSQPIYSIPEAVTMIGGNRLQALVMSAWAFFFIDERTCPDFSPAAEWSHAWEVAKVTQQLAKEQKLPKTVAEEAFIAGLLHDIGKIALAANEPFAYSMILKEAKKSNRQVWEVEKENLGCTHAELVRLPLSHLGNALADCGSRRLAP